MPRSTSRRTRRATVLPVVATLSFVLGAAVMFLAVRGQRTKRGTGPRPTPPSRIIKGHQASMLYHPPDSPYYKRIEADVWFATPADAEAAGYTGWNRRRP